MQEKLTEANKRLFVIHFTNDFSNEVFAHYYYMNHDATLDGVKAMVVRFDQGDADPGTASYPIEIRNWSDVDPANYNYIFFAQDQLLDQQELTLLEFMKKYWTHSNTQSIPQSGNSQALLHADDECGLESCGNEGGDEFGRDNDKAVFDELVKYGNTDVIQLGADTLDEEWTLGYAAGYSAGKEASKSSQTPDWIKPDVSGLGLNYPEVYFDGHQDGYRTALTS